jgi:hypothetical protein
MRSSLLLALFALCLGWFAGPASSGSLATQSEVESIARKATVAWLDTLGLALEKQASFKMEDDERRAWSNLPHTMFARKGVAFGEMNDAQRIAAHAMLRQILSSGGYLRVTGIMRGDDILASLFTKSNPEAPDPYGHQYYWLGVFGDPRGEGDWGLQLDGHHLGINITASNGELRVTPTFLGGNPVEVPSGPYAGWRVLAQLDELGLTLYRSLSEEQREKAVIAKKSPGDVLAGPSKAGLIGEQQGIPVALLDREQRDLVEELVRDYVMTYRRELSATALHEFRKDLEEGVHFAWLGGDEDQPYAYRIHGPRTWIEFSNVRGAGSEIVGMNHIHAVWRRLGDDYGDSLIAESR